MTCANCRPLWYEDSSADGGQDYKVVELCTHHADLEQRLQDQERGFKIYEEATKALGADYQRQLETKEQRLQEAERLLREYGVMSSGFPWTEVKKWLERRGRS